MLNLVFKQLLGGMKDMLNGKRKQHNAQFKFKVALEAAKGLKTVNQLAAEYQLHPSQVSQWKTQLLQEGEAVFTTRKRRAPQPEAQTTELYEQIGRLKMEVEWLKKKAAPFH